MPKKRTANGIRKEKEEVKREVQRALFKGSGHAAHRMADQLIQRANSGVDVGYLRTLLFPELYNADVPQPLSTQSYCRFTDKKEWSITSGGSGLLVWYPKTVIGPQLFIRSKPNDIKAFQVGTGADDWKCGGFMNYGQYFSQANLVSASMQIQYVGQLQMEQGYFVGSQLYGISPSTVVAEDIENGQYRLMEKPGDGVRCIYMPKDMQDYTYYQVSGNKAKNNGSRPEGETVVIGTAAAAPAAEAMINGEASTAWGEMANKAITFSLEADFVAIYWKGLASGGAVSEDLRIDIVRKFNGFPLAKERDILDLQKPKKIFDPKRTIDVVQQLQDNIPQLCGHSIKSMDRVSDEIQEFLPNLGHLYSEGLLKEGTTMRGFADQLQAVNGMEGTVIIPGRLYE